MKARRRLLLTIAITGISFVVGYFVNFFLTRFITDTIGTDAYGFVTLCKTTATYTAIATTALNSYASRYIALEYHSGNKKKASVYFNTVLVSNFLMGLVLLLASIICTKFLKVLFNVPDSLLSDVTNLFILIFANIFISLCSTAFQASAYIANKLIITSFTKGCSYILEAMTLLSLYSLLPARIFYVGVGIIVATMLNITGFFFIYRKYTWDIKINVREFSWAAVKELVFAGFWNSVNALGNTLNNGIDLIISNALLTPFAMGQVSIVKSISTIFSNLYQMIAQPFQPILLKLYADNNKSGLLSEFKFSMKLSGMISNLAFGIVVAFGFSYYLLWLPEQETQLLYKLTIIAASTSIMEGPVYPLYYIYTLTVRNKIPCLITIAGGVLNVLGMFVLIKTTHLGVYSIFITTAVIMTFINGVTNPIYMCKCLNISWATFYPILFRHIIACALVSLVMTCIGKVTSPLTWASLIIFAFLSCVVGGFVHFFIVFDKNEWGEIKRTISKMCNRL